MNIARTSKETDSWDSGLLYFAENSMIRNGMPIIHHAESKVQSKKRHTKKRYQQTTFWFFKLLGVTTTVSKGQGKKMGRRRPHFFSCRFPFVWRRKSAIMCVTKSAEHLIKNITPKCYIWKCSTVTRKYTTIYGRLWTSLHSEQKSKYLV